MTDKSDGYGLRRQRRWRVDEAPYSDTRIRRIFERSAGYNNPLHDSFAAMQIDWVDTRKILCARYAAPLPRESKVRTELRQWILRVESNCSMAEPTKGNLTATE